MQPPIALPDLVPVGGQETELWKRLRENPREQERHRTILSYSWQGRVLDIGIGHGYVACLIARAHRPDLIVGVDLETAWVKRAR